MLISIDYDGTYSADPKCFDQIITEFRTNGHDVIMVTARCTCDKVSINTNLDLKVYYTCGKDKDPFMSELGFSVDLWVEDRPQSVGKVDNWVFDEDKQEWYQKEESEC